MLSQLFFGHQCSLHARFRNAVLGIAVVLAAIVATIAYLSAKSHYVETGEASARAIVSAVQQTLSVGVYARDEVLLKELIDGVTRHPSVARISVRDTFNNALITSVASGAMVQDSIASPGEASFESMLVSPFNPNEIIGRLQVWLDSTRLAAEARHQASILVGALIVLMAGMLMVFNILASELLSKPMHRLAATLERLQPGSFERLIIAPQHAHDEIGIVTAATNRLLNLQQKALESEWAVRKEISALEARYRGIFDSTSAGIFILSTTGALLQANPALSRLLEQPDNEFNIIQVANFAKTAFAMPEQLSRLMERAQTSTLPEAADLELLRRDGGTLWVHCMVSALFDATSGEHRIEGVLYDITRRKLQEHAAQHCAEHDALTGLKSRAFIESSLGQHVQTAGRDDGAVTLMFIDLDGFKAVNDRWGHATGDVVLVEAARRLQALFQRSCDTIGRLGGDELVVMIMGVEATHPSIAVMATQLINSFKTTFALPNGETVLVGASVGVASYPLHATNSKTLIHAADAAMYAVKQSGKGGFAIAQINLATADFARESDLSHSDAHVLTQTVLETTKQIKDGLRRDPLTGLMDRRRLIEQLTAAHARVSAGAKPVAVVCLDISQFKLLNVAHGSHIGDEVLCEVAHRFIGTLRRTDLIARTGSDEFVAVLSSNGAGDEAAHRMAERVALKLLASLTTPLRLSTCTLTIHASAGVSLVDAHAADGLVVLREAQLALRRSKSLGRNRLVFFEQTMMSGFHDQLALEEDLRTAIGSSQLFLQVQPQVDGQGVVTGGEALLRWQHPVRGLVSPDQFISLAESCGIIIELGTWVLHSGCKILADLQKHNAALTLAINISPAQFNYPDFAQQVRKALGESGASAGGLILEITEGLLITDMDYVTERLHELVAMGVRFSIDDFGTGFSSLSYLRHLPLYEIKIDRSFISGLPNDVASAGIVCSILSMGSHLGLHVVAEGVETLEQSHFLAANGCLSQQGWLYGRPMPVETFLQKQI